MDCSVVFLRLLQRLRARGRFQHGITDALEVFPSHFAKRPGVFGQQNGFASREDWRLQIFLSDWLNSLFDAREIHLEECALIKLTVDPDVSAALLYDAVDRC